MESEAEKLRSETYRSEKIARAAREGRKLSHPELQAMIPRLQAGDQRAVFRKRCDEVREAEALEDLAGDGGSRPWSMKFGASSM